MFNLILFSSTNYHSIDNLEDYIQDYKDNDEEAFKNYSFAIKVMPSYNFESNAIFLEPSTKQELTQINDSASIQSEMDMESTFYYIENTRDFFPTLENTEESIPVGNSLKMCVNIFWSNNKCAFLSSREELLAF